MSKKVYVGFETAVVEGTDWKKFVDVGDLTDLTEAKKAAALAKRDKINFAAMPYTGRLKRVAFVIPGESQPILFADKPVKGKGTGATAAIQPLRCASVVEYLLTKFAGPEGEPAWHNDTNPDRRTPPVAIFVGFDPKLFLKMLGLGCMLERTAAPLGLWYGNSDHRDIENALLPTEAKELTWDMVFARLRGLYSGDAKTRFDKLVEKFEPGKDAVVDAALSYELGDLLGFNADDNG